MHIPTIIKMYRDGSVGVMHIVLYVVPASLQALRHALKRWECCKV